MVCCTGSVQFLKSRASVAEVNGAVESGMGFHSKKPAWREA
jgi:hypothetical protein